MRRCCICERKTETRAYYTSNGACIYICDKCVNNTNMSTCRKCGRPINRLTENKIFVYDESAIRNLCSHPGSQVSTICTLCERCIEHIKSTQDTTHEEPTIRCISCGVIIYNQLPYDNPCRNNFGDYVCFTCFEKYYALCSFCRCIIDIENDQYYDVDDMKKISCLSCYRTYTIECDICGQPFSRDNIIEIGDTECCYVCYENASRCYVCGELAIGRDTTQIAYEIICGDCVDDLQIHQYYYRPEPIFHKLDTENTIYLGVELEYDDLMIDDIIYFSEDVVRANSDYLYIKLDGSLDSGIEVVSHPMTYQAHKRFIWKELFDNYFSKWGTHNGAGLHVHVSKTAYAPLDVIKIMHILSKDLSFDKRIAGRPLNDYCKPNDPDEAYELYVIDGSVRTLSRFYAINPLNTNTIEWRMFKSPNTYERFIASLEFVYGMTLFVKLLNIYEVRLMSIKEIVKLFNEFCLEHDFNYISELLKAEL